MNELLNLTPSQLQSVAFFSLSEVANFNDGQIIIKPIEEWTSTQQLSADIIYDDRGETVGIECRSLKLEALELLASRIAPKSRSKAR